MDIVDVVVGRISALQNIHIDHEAGADLPRWHGVATATLKIALPPQLPPQLAALKTKKGCGSSDICESEFLISD